MSDAEVAVMDEPEDALADRKAKKKAAAKRQRVSPPAPPKDKPEPVTVKVAPTPAQATAPMSPVLLALQAVQTLRTGIASRDWRMVEEAYAHLAGEPAPGPQLDDPASVLAAIGDLVRAHLGGERAFRPLPVPAPFSPSVSTNDQPNEFVDDPRMNAAEVEESRGLSQKMRGREREVREAYTPLVLNCSKCHKDAEINPALRPLAVAPGDKAQPFVCNDCQTGRRRS